VFLPSPSIFYSLYALSIPQTAQIADNSETINQYDPTNGDLLTETLLFHVATPSRVYSCHLVVDNEQSLPREAILVLTRNTTASHRIDKTLEMAKSFGRVDFNALLGAGSGGNADATEEMAAFRPWMMPLP
jgi:hypothetical protein